MNKYDFSALKNINYAEGLKYSEQEETYAAVLGDFHRFIEKNAEVIDLAEKQKNAEDYVREVHKLKSSARLIGAAELSELALRLEMKGRENDWSVIERETPLLLEKYREFEEILKPFEKKRPRKEGAELSRVELEKELESLLETLSCFDYDASMEIISRLDAHALPKSFAEGFDALRDSVESFEFEEAENYVNQ